MSEQRRQTARHLAVGAILLLAGFLFSGELLAQSLVERLGFEKDARLLIINADDFGMCHSANVGTISAFERGGVTSSTIMTPCPWFLEGARWAKEHKRASVGVHLTLTSEWGIYKWGPVTGWKNAPGLCDENGWLVKDEGQLYTGKNLDQAEAECRAQIERALAVGWDVTHIDCHMGCLQYDPRYLAVYLKLAKEYNFPCRMPSKRMVNEEFSVALKSGAFGKMSDEMVDTVLKGYRAMLDQFAAAGIITPDELILSSPKSPWETERFWKGIMEAQKPGTVMELYIHCADNSEEMKMFSGSQRQRYFDTEFFSDPRTRQWIADQGIQLISYRELRELQRTGKPIPRIDYSPWTE